MRFAVRNLSINFSYNAPEEDWMGVAEMTIKEKDMRDWCSDVLEIEYDLTNFDPIEVDCDECTDYMTFDRS